MRKELGATLVGFAVFFLLVFVASLHHTLRRAEGEGGVFSSSALTGGVAMVVFLGASAAFETAVASAEGFYDAFEVDSDMVLAFSTLSLWSLGLALPPRSTGAGDEAGLTAQRSRLVPPSAPAQAAHLIGIKAHARAERLRSERNVVLLSK